ncbi:MAG: hypothetical protein EXR76_03960 [Myxococcales bacterium]|nr:hypothetical protein [Myxococcales bacterium]
MAEFASIYPKNSFKPAHEASDVNGIEEGDLTMEDDGSPKVALSTTSLDHYFKSSLDEVLVQQKTEIDEATHSYLVSMLTSFAERSATMTETLDDLMDEPLGVQMMRAMQSDGQGRFQTLKQIGDTSLYLTGFFSESLSRSLNGERYYIDVGSGAYHGAAQSLSRGGPSNPFKQMYEGLAVRFVEMVDIINEVSERCFRQDQDVLRIYERYATTGSPRAAARLASLGVALGNRPWTTH